MHTNSVIVVGRQDCELYDLLSRNYTMQKSHNNIGERLQDQVVPSNTQ